MCLQALCQSSSSRKLSLGIDQKLNKDLYTQIFTIISLTIEIIGNNLNVKTREMSNYNYDRFTFLDIIPLTEFIMTCKIFLIKWKTR